MYGDKRLAMPRHMPVLRFILQGKRCVGTLCKTLFGVAHSSQQGNL